MPENGGSTDANPLLLPHQAFQRVGGSTDANPREGLGGQPQRLQAELDAVTARLASALAENPAEATPAATASVAAHRVAALVEALADSPTES